MKIGNCTYSLRDYIRAGNLRVENFAMLSRAMDIYHLEYNVDFFESNEEDYLQKIKDSVQQAEAKTSCVTMGGNLAGETERERLEQIEVISGWMEVAAFLGAPVCRINIGGAGNEEADATVGVERVAWSFNKLLPLAREKNLKMTIENHGGVSRKADLIIAVIEATDKEYVGACPDFGNFPADVRYEELEKVAPYAYHIHAKSHHFKEDGEERDIDYKRVVDIFRNTGYQGVFSIEFEGPGDQIEGVKKTRNLLQKYL
jgi:sugar phosphate isomerase/epimerase